MSKADLLQRLGASGDALTATLRRVQPNEWLMPTRPGKYSPHDYVNYAASILELAGNSYLQSLRMDPVMMEADIDAEARRNVQRRKERAPATDFDDYQASLRSLLILIDMASDAQIDELVQGRSRADRFDVQAPDQARSTSYWLKSATPDVYPA
jgi:hypothetical protein